LNFITKKPRAEVISNYLRVIEFIYDPKNYYGRIMYNGLNLKADYKFKPSFKMTLKYLGSFLKVCAKVGFRKQLGPLYWKMFFTILFKNPKAIEAAVNLAAMYIHFEKQKYYVVSAMNKMANDLRETGETELYRSMVDGYVEPSRNTSKLTESMPTEAVKTAPVL